MKIRSKQKKYGPFYKNVRVLSINVSTKDNEIYSQIKDLIKEGIPTSVGAGAAKYIGISKPDKTFFVGQREGGSAHYSCVISSDHEKMLTKINTILDGVAKNRNISIAEMYKIVEISSLTAVVGFSVPQKIADFETWDRFVANCCENQRKTLPKFAVKNGDLIVGSTSSEAIIAGLEYNDASEPTQLAIVYKAKKAGCRNLFAILKQPNSKLETAVASQILRLIDKTTVLGLLQYIQQRLLSVYPLEQVSQNTVKIESEALSKEARYVKRCLKSIYTRLENDRTSQETTNLLNSFVEEVVANQKEIVSFESLQSGLQKLLPNNSTEPDPL